MPPLPTPTHVVFDWDNTLVDNWAASVAGNNAALTAFNMPLVTPEQAMKRFYRSLREDYPEIFGDQWEKARAIFYETFERVHLDTIKKIPDVDALLQAIKAKGLPMAIISNKTSKYLHQEVEAMGWTKLFDAIIGAGDAPRDKPSPDPMHLLKQRMAIAADARIWYVGDRQGDVDFAFAAGVHPILMFVADHPKAAFFNAHAGLIRHLDLILSP